MFKRCLIVLIMALSLQMATINSAVAGGVPSDDAQMTLKVIRDVISRFTQVATKLDEIKSKVDLVYQLKGVGAALQTNFTNLACIAGGAVGRQTNDGAVMLATSTAGSYCGGGGIGAVPLPVEQLWKDITFDGADIADEGLDSLNNILNAETIVPIEVFDGLNNLLITGEGVEGDSVEEKQFNTRKVREGLSRNATITALSNVGKIQNDIAKYKTTSSELIEDCANSSSAFAEAIACATQGVGVNMLLEMERTKVLANSGMSSGYANLVTAKTDIEMQ